MKFYIKQRVFSIGQKLDVCDKDGNYQYYCRGEVLTVGRKLHIYDRADNEVAYIKQQLFRMLPHYDIYINGKFITTLVKKFTFFTHDYYYGDLPYEIDGQFLAHDYNVYDNGNNTLMKVEKQWLTWGDTYVIDIIDEKQLLLMLASAIVLTAFAMRVRAASNT